MAAQFKIFYSGHPPTGAGDVEAAATRNYLSLTSKLSHSPDLESHHSTTGVSVCKLSPSQTDRITQQYGHSLIARVVGKDIHPWQLARSLHRHLRLTENVEVFELGLGYFVLKFSETDYFALEDHPWPIPNLCIHTVPWTPNFKPSEATDSVVDAWIRLHELSIEYYDEEILRQIAETIGLALVKIDPVTKDRKKCKYARICVRMNLCYPLPSTIRLGGIRQEIEYEGFDLLCHRCRRVVHLKHDCLSNPHYRTAPSFQEIGSSSNSKQPLISSEASAAWGSRYHVLGTESKEPLFLI